MADAGQSRVFFALWPDPAVRARLHAESLRLSRLLGGKPSKPDSLHLTLVFVGELENARLADLAAVAERVTSPRFELSLDREACWRHNHIAHLGASQPPAALLDLVGRLSVNLKAAGIAFDARPFAPHVTLVRKADCARHLARGKDGNEAGNEVGNEAGNENPASGPIRWSARDFVLVRSSLRAEGARYEQLGRWPLL